MKQGKGKSSSYHTADIQSNGHLIEQNLLEQETKNEIFVANSNFLSEQSDMPQAIERIEDQKQEISSLSTNPQGLYYSSFSQNQVLERSAISDQHLKNIEKPQSENVQEEQENKTVLQEKDIEKEDYLKLLDPSQIIIPPPPQIEYQEAIIDLVEEEYDHQVPLEFEQPKYQAFFSVNYYTKFGQKIVVCGSSKSLGNWDPNKGLQLDWTENGIWAGQMRSQEDLVGVQYKFVCIGENCKWENGCNRKLKDAEYQNGIYYYNKYQELIWQA